MKHIITLCIVTCSVFYSAYASTSLEHLLKRIAHETTTYLHNIDYSRVTTCKELQTHITTNYNRDTANIHIFPVLQAFLRDRTLVQYDNEIKTCLKHTIEAFTTEKKRALDL